MFQQYISPLEKAKRYLSQFGSNDEDEKFIQQAKSQGYGEDVYAPAIASKKLRQQDAELDKYYQSYKASPTTLMSNFKSEYGKEDRGIVGDTIGFMQNFFMDIGENIEELSSVIANPIDTAKGLGTLGKGLVTGDKNTYKAIGGLIKENFGSWDKAKETFYENPFDVISIVFPALKATKAGKAAQLVGKAKYVETAEKLGKIGKKMGKSEGFAGLVGKVSGETGYTMSKAEKLVYQLADLSNFDINILKATGQGLGAVGAKGGKVLSSYVFKNPETLKNLMAKAKTGQGRLGLKAAEGLSDKQMVNKVTRGMDVAEEAMQKDYQKAVSATAKEGTKSIDTFIKGESIFEGKKFLFGDKAEGKFVKIVDDVGETTPDVIKAEEKINEAFKMSGLTKDYMKDFNPESVDKFVRTLQNAVKNKELPKTSTDLLEVFIGEAKEIQNKAFPLIAETRKNAREFYEWSKEMRKEIPTTGKTETILNAIRKSGDKDTSRAMLTYMRDKGNVDLTDLSLALASKQWMGSGSRFALTGVGAFGYYFLQNPAMLAGIIGHAALTTPAILYKVSKMVGTVKQPVGAVFKKVNKIANAMGVSPDELITAARKVNMKGANTYFGFLKELGKETIKKSPKIAVNRKMMSFYDRLVRNIGEQYGNMQEGIQSEAQEMESTMQEGIERFDRARLPQDIISTTEIPEGLEINPDLLK